MKRKKYACSACGEKVEVVKKVTKGNVCIPCFTEIHTLERIKHHFRETSRITRIAGVAISPPLVSAVTHLKKAKEIFLAFLLKIIACLDQLKERLSNDSLKKLKHGLHLISHELKFSPIFLGSL